MNKDKYCQDPRGKHKKRIYSNVRNVSENISLLSKGKLKINSLICNNCIKDLKKDPQKFINICGSPIPLNEGSDNDSASSMCTSSTDVDIPESIAVNAESILSISGVSPVKTKGLNDRQRVKKGKEKLKTCIETIQSHLEQSYRIELPVQIDELQIYENLMDELVEEFNIADNKKKLQILTLSPFTIEKTAEKFNTSSWMVKKSRYLKNMYGILPEIPPMSKGMIITSDMKKKVQEFYDRDDISRIFPGKKDRVIIRNNQGEKTYVQKRLLLCNLKEAHIEYKNTEGTPNIGFSSFAFLRPSHCIVAGGSGTHTVCVCTHHQNPKLQIAALGEKGLTYRDLLTYAVCDIDNRDCMLHRCKHCDREIGVKSFLECLDSVERADNFITYKQWQSTDRCILLEKTESQDAFISSLSLSISKLTRHHFIALEQSTYFKNLKETIQEGELVLVGDFSENYSFVVQDAVQGYHWDNSQCTIHPFVAYYPSSNGVQHQSYCFISNDLKHNATMVYTFLNQLIAELKSKHKSLRKIHYFSDGCGGQYKNRFNFINLCHHLKDFGIEAEWNFFATSHGKNACDGIGGTIKRSLTKASLMRTVAHQILSPEDAFEYCTKNLSINIIFFYVSATEVSNFKDQLESRLNLAHTLEGTRRFHKFVPLNESQLKVFETSSDTIGYIKCITKESSSTRNLEVKIGYYVVCVYDDEIWIGLVNEYEEEFNDFLISFLYPQGFSKQYKFPPFPDRCYVPEENILGVLKTPNLIGGSRIAYSFNEKELRSFIDYSTFS